MSRKLSMGEIYEDQLMDYDKATIVEKGCIGLLAVMMWSMFRLGGKYVTVKDRRKNDIHSELAPLNSHSYLD